MTPCDPVQKERGDSKWKLKSQPCLGQCTAHRIMESLCWKGPKELSTLSSCSHPDWISLSFFFHFVVIISHPPTRHPAVQSFISLMNLRASGATFRYVPSCLFPRMSQCCSFSLSSHPQRVSALTLSILVALSWTPSVHWCLPLDAFQRWLVFDFDTAALHVLSHYMLFADQEQPKSSQGFQRQITWLRIEPLELFSETLFLSKAKRPFHSNS